MTARIINRLSAYDGRTPVGTILELDDGRYQAVNLEGELIGEFKSRIEASKALSAVQAA